MSKMDASRLEWHDAVVDAVERDLPARRMTWEVEIFRWDIQEDGDAQPGRVWFEGVEQVEGVHDLADGLEDGEVYWGVLKSEFDRSAGRVRCLFMLELSGLRNTLSGSGYADLMVVCRELWFTPSAENS